eukprot:14509956-Heterocapsa_arctica.AAC.1
MFPGRLSVWNYKLRRRDHTAGRTTSWGRRDHTAGEPEAEEQKQRRRRRIMPEGEGEAEG